MEFLLVLALMAGVIYLAVSVSKARQRKELEAHQARELEKVRKVADEDVTRFGEELMDLHVETMTDDLDDAMRGDYQQALDAYEDAKTALGSAATAEDVTQTVRRLADGRHHLACVLARRDDVALPERRPPCFFDPAHGPSSRDVTWSPPGGVEREIPVCFRDAERLASGEAPRPRLVRLGDRHVAWYAAGPAYAPWASGWFDRLARDRGLEAERLTMMFAPGVALTSLEVGGLTGWSDAGWADHGGWSDPGGWTPGELGTGHDYGGHDPGGGFDLGGGGFDGGGGGGGDSG